MDFKYSSNKNVQMLLSLFKANNIKKVIISPGAAHIAITASLQHDDYFEKYSAIDERGAAYMATGLSMESGEPVVLVCTGATASRNYLPALTEAHYRKLPIIAVTATQALSMTGHLSPQFIERTSFPSDTVDLSVHLQKIQNSNDIWDCNIKINKALLEVRRDGGKVVHINLTEDNADGLVSDELVPVRVIRRFTADDSLPKIPENTKVAITVGGHHVWSDELTETVDKFCEQYNAVVFIDHSSGYHGKYRVLPTLITSQQNYYSELINTDLLIHIGEQSGDYYTLQRLPVTKAVWRVSPDGEIRDTFSKLTNVFEMSELRFFKSYLYDSTKKDTSYFNAWCSELKAGYACVPDLPFSNIYVANTLSKKLPENSVIHLGVSNTQRAWTFFELPNSIMSIANVGARGIDGALSSAIGMSLANPDKIHYCFLGDLTFFYDMNSLGIRSIQNNLRILLVNNGGGAEFNQYDHSGYKQMGDNVNRFVAGSGHYGAIHPELVKKYAEGLGFDYMSASNKDEFNSALPKFTDNQISNLPMILEVHTEFNNESRACQLIRNCIEAPQSNKHQMIKKYLGENGTKLAMKILGKK